MLSVVIKPFMLSVFVMNAIKLSIIMLSVLLFSFKLKTTFISAFHIPSDMTRPLRYSGNVLETCSINKSNTSDSRYFIVFA